jgi:hypothetical protein
VVLHTMIPCELSTITIDDIGVQPTTIVSTRGQLLRFVSCGKDIQEAAIKLDECVTALLKLSRPSQGVCDPEQSSHLTENGHCNDLLRSQYTFLFRRLPRPSQWKFIATLSSVPVHLMTVLLCIEAVQTYAEMNRPCAWKIIQMTAQYNASMPVVTSIKMALAHEHSLRSQDADVHSVWQCFNEKAIRSPRGPFQLIFIGQF